MSTPVEVLVVVFKDQDRADAMVQTLTEMNKRGAVKLLDAATVTRPASGKPKLKEIDELTTVKGGERGAIVGGILGLIFPPSLLAGVAVGAIAGSLWGKLRDTGITSDELEQIADALKPDEVAVIAVVEDIWVQQFLDAVSGYNRLFRQALDAEAAAVLSADPETGDIAAAGFERTDTVSSSAPSTAPENAGS